MVRHFFSVSGLMPNIVATSASVIQPTSRAAAAAPRSSGGRRETAPSASDRVIIFSSTGIDLHPNRAPNNEEIGLVRIIETLPTAVRSRKPRLLPDGGDRQRRPRRSEPRRVGSCRCPAVPAGSRSCTGQTTGPPPSAGSVQKLLPTLREATRDHAPRRRLQPLSGARYVLCGAVEKRSSF